MKKILNQYAWLRGILAILLIGAGITIIAFAIINQNQVGDAVKYAFASIAIAFGTILILLSLTSETRAPFTNNLLYGSILLALGITSLIVDNFITSLFVNLLAVLLIVIGGVCLVKAVFSIVYRMRKVFIFLLFLVGAICLTLGIMSLCFKEYSFISTFITVGVLITGLGVFELILLIIKKSHYHRLLHTK